MNLPGYILFHSIVWGARTKYIKYIQSIVCNVCNAVQCIFVVFSYRSGGLWLCDAGNNVKANAFPNFEASFTLKTNEGLLLVIFYLRHSCSWCLIFWSGQFGQYLRRVNDDCVM